MNKLKKINDKMSNKLFEDLNLSGGFNKFEVSQELTKRIKSGVSSSKSILRFDKRNKPKETGSKGCKFKTAGILGGMGPEATLDLHRKILNRSDVEKDQDNIPMMIFNNPQIPDRSDYILDEGESPLGEIIRTAISLERAGADFIVIPCNTAHHFFEKIDSAVDIETINLIEETVDFVVENHTESEKIGLLITTGSMETKVYSNFIRDNNRIPLLPDENFQENVMDSIYEIKKGEKIESKKKLERATEHLIRKGADTVIMGCTEIPLVLSNDDFPVPLIDPVEIIAEKTVKVSKGESSYTS